MKKIVPILLRFIGFGILIGLFATVGIENIFKAILQLDATAVVIAFGLLLAASALRLVKFRFLFPPQGWKKNLHLLALSSLGGELSIVGYFAPMAHTDFQNQDAAKGLILNRFFEYLATFLIAAICTIPLIAGNGDFLWFCLGFFAVTVAGFLVPFAPFEPRFKNRILAKIVGFTTNLRNGAKVSKNVSIVFFLSVLASLLDFAVVGYLFFVLGNSVSFLFVPIFWALSGVLGFVTFMNMGPNDVATVVLFDHYAGVSAEVTAAMVVLARSLFLLARILVYLLSEAINRYRPKPEEKVTHESS